MMPASPTQVNVEREGALAVLRFEGDITSASSAAILGAYRDLQSEITEILLDFSKVPYVNSSGVALIIHLLTEVNHSGRMVQTFGLTTHVQRVFTMLGLTKYTAIYPDERAARAARSI